uniref:Apolipoprotein M n=1 Tax=Sphaeramia orbicularis TaxID=375764 RepID=A0A672ZZM6_9TELE
IQQFKEMDSVLFTMEDTGNATLLLTGHMRIGDHCINQTWTYSMHLGRDDLELKGRPQRRNLLWSGKWANCSDCIIFQEIEPPLNETGTEDSLNRLMLYSRKSDLDADSVTAFQKNAACNNMTAFVRLPQDKGLCFR